MAVSEQPPWERGPHDDWGRSGSTVWERPSSYRMSYFSPWSLGTPSPNLDFVTGETEEDGTD